MNIRNDFPFAVREIEQIEIPLSDGTRLAARIWLPEGAETAPVPAILEYLPYRKRDGTAVRDALTHPWFAGHGYACIRVDMRGNGESEGLMADEYLPQEQADALEVIDWLCAQPWCDGKIGMMGISWGGFNSLQVAALKPEPLKAIITLCSTDDRFADDIHYKGGNMLLENVGWAATMLSFSSAVPDPLLVDDWRERWLERLDNMPLLLETWISHQSRDDYWRHGSICENYGDIEAAVYAIGGWGDAYSNTIGRMMEKLSCPRKALVGPWAHKYPHFAVPDPAIGFLQEALRWWDHWLKGIDTGIMAEPQCTWYLQDAVAPQPSYPARDGDWVRTDRWPATDISPQTLYLDGERLSDKAPTQNAGQLIASPLTTGSNGGEYCVIWLGPEFPTDQRRDDGQSVCFTSAPLEQELKLLGAPRIRLQLSSDRECGQLTVRLNDIAPDGSSTRITYGCLNLRMRDGLGQPRPLQPGEAYEIDLALDDVGYKVPAGHRLRIALSSAYFPLLWPAPEFASLRLHGNDNRIELPVCNAEALPASPFEAPEGATPEPLEYLQPASNSRTVTEDVVTGEVCTCIEDDFGEIRYLRHGLEVHQAAREEYRVRPRDPDSARADTHWRYSVGRDDWKIEVETRMRLSCDAEYFYLDASLDARENGTPVRERRWQRRIRREHI